ncbi:MULTISPECIES: hypothetical protein [Nocardia]|uniref:hypothetical protein n=1 Tax=Nocardia TaxID=1817 RepID=UPI00031BC205|nr:MULTISPECIES: hypothetical protein [Nocardia]
MYLFEPGEIYARALDDLAAEELLITRVDTTFDRDTFLPLPAQYTRVESQPATYGDYRVEHDTYRLSTGLEKTL